MDVYDIVHVAVAPSDTVETSLIKEVAGIINKDLYETRLLLSSGKIPRIVAHCQGMPVANSVAQRLRALGLVTIVCKDTELRQPSRRFRAFTLKLGDEDVVFQDKGSQARTIRAGNALLILKGVIKNYTETEAESTRMKFSLAGTVLTGGVPIFRKVKEKSSELSVETECFVRCYDQMSPDISVEILQHDFDYSFLKTKMASSSHVNLNTTIAELRRTFTQAVFDDRLTQPFRVDIPSTTQRDDIEIICKLVFLYHQAMGNLGPQHS